MKRARFNGGPREGLDRMHYKEILTEIVVSVLNERRAEFSCANRIATDENSPIYGEGAPFDSIELVRLIVMLEEKIEEKTGTTVRLTSISAFISEKSPFGTIGSVAKFIESTIKGGT